MPEGQDITSARYDILSNIPPIKSPNSNPATTTSVRAPSSSLEIPFNNQEDANHLSHSHFKHQTPDFRTSTISEFCHPLTHSPLNQSYEYPRRIFPLVSVSDPPTRLHPLHSKNTTHSYTNLSIRRGISLLLSSCHSYFPLTHHKVEAAERTVCEHDISPKDYLDTDSIRRPLLLG